MALWLHWPSRVTRPYQVNCASVCPDGALDCGAPPGGHANVLGVSHAKLKASMLQHDKRRNPASTPIQRPATCCCACIAGPGAQSAAAHGAQGGQLLHAAEAGGGLPRVRRVLRAQPPPLRAAQLCGDAPRAQHRAGVASHCPCPSSQVKTAICYVPQRRGHMRRCLPAKSHDSARG